jgi:hypothetical protein
MATQNVIDTPIPLTQANGGTGVIEFYYRAICYGHQFHLLHLPHLFLLLRLCLPNTAGTQIIACNNSFIYNECPRYLYSGKYNRTTINVACLVLYRDGVAIAGCYSAHQNTQSNIVSIRETSNIRLYSNYNIYITSWR